MPKITIVPPQAPQQPKAPSIGGSPQSNAAQSARAAAIAKLVGGSAQPMGNSQETPVQNPSQISIEETTNLNSSTQSAGQQDKLAEALSDKPKDNAEAPQVATQAPQAAAPEEEPLSQQYAVLARKEKALRAKVSQQDQQLKQRESDLAAREAELSSKSTIDTSKYISIDELKRNAFSKLQEIGVSYDDFSAQALAAQSPEAQALKAMREEFQSELQKVREEQANTRKSYEEQQTNAYKQAINQIKQEAQSLVDSDPSFETIKVTNTVGDVVELIERTFKTDGTLLTVEQAAKLVEEELVEEALKIARIEKIQAKLRPTQPVVNQAKPSEQPQPQQAQMKTLTNSHGVTRQLTGRERAILAAKGEKF